MLSYLIPGTLVLIVLLFLFIKNNQGLKRMSFGLELGGIIYGGIIAIYALILAFVVIVVWQQYQNSGDRLEKEASKLFDVYRSSFAFRDSTNRATAGKMRASINDYVQNVIHDEWPALKRNQTSPPTQYACDSIWKAVMRISPANEREKIWYATTLENMNQFSEARHLRMADREYDVPLVMWIMLITGAAIIILFSMFLDRKNNGLLHLVKVLMISTLIIFSLMLVNLLSHPFKGIMSIPPTAFVKFNAGHW